MDTLKEFIEKFGEGPNKEVDKRVIMEVAEILNEQPNLSIDKIRNIIVQPKKPKYDTTSGE